MWVFEHKATKDTAKTDTIQLACMHAHVHKNTHNKPLNFSTNGPQWIGYKGDDVMSVIETVSLHQRFISYPAVLTDAKQI